MKPNYRQAFLVCSFVVSVMFLQTYLLYQHIEANVKIPEEWLQNLKQQCPGVRKTETFHHNSMASMAYPLLTPFYFFWLYMKHESTIGK